MVGRVPHNLSIVKQGVKQVDFTIFTRSLWITMIAEEYMIPYDRAAFAVDILMRTPERKHYSVENLLGIEPGPVDPEYRISV